MASWRILAATGFLFTRAYCQQAVCSPSRSSLMTGRRPDTIRIWDLSTHFRDNVPGVEYNWWRTEKSEKLTAMLFVRSET